MRRTVKYVALAMSVAILTGCGGSDDTAAQVAPALLVSAPAPAPTPEPPAPPVAPEPPAKARPSEPFQYGDDPTFDALWEDCQDADYEACEELYWDSPLDSQYESDALSMMNIMDEGMTPEELNDLISGDLLLDIVWAGMSSREQSELCDGYALSGSEASGAIIADSSGGTITGREASDWLRRTC